MKLGTLGPRTTPGRPAKRSRTGSSSRLGVPGWPQLNREDLVFGRYGIVEDRVTGNFYRLCRGELTDSLYSGAVAIFEDAAGAIRFLEPPTGFPSNRAELEQRRAAREQRRNAPKPSRQAKRR